MTDFGPVTMYWGCAGGSQSKALRHMEEPHAMISYTSTSEIKDWMEYSFLDSGGYSLMLEKGEHPPASEYMAHVEEIEPSRYALQDYPCEPDILEEYGRTVEDHQQMSVDKARECLDYHETHGLESQPIPVMQGWEVNDYLRHVDQMRDAGCLTDSVGIGSICRRGQDSEIREVILSVADALPNGTDIHCFGVKNNILRYPQVRAVVSSVDSSAWYFRMYDDKPVDEPAWQTCVYMYIKYRRKLYEKMEQNSGDGQTQATLPYEPA